MTDISLQQTLEQADQIDYDIHLTGLTEDTIKKISADQNEPERMLQHRLASLKIYHETPLPER